MRTFEIKFIYHKGVIFGNGIKQTELAKGTSENNAIKNFLKQKRSAGQIVVIETTKHIPVK